MIYLRHLQDFISFFKFTFLNQYLLLELLSWRFGDSYVYFKIEFNHVPWFLFPFTLWLKAYFFSLPNTSSWLIYLRHLQDFISFFEFTFLNQYLLLELLAWHFRDTYLHFKSEFNHVPWFLFPFTLWLKAYFFSLPNRHQVDWFICDTSKILFHFSNSLFYISIYF